MPGATLRNQSPVSILSSNGKRRSRQRLTPAPAYAATSSLAMMLQRSKLSMARLNFPRFPLTNLANHPKRRQKFWSPWSWHVLVHFCETLANIWISYSHNQLTVLQILTLYGIKHLYIDGQLSYQQRAKVVAQFCSNPEYRVLIMSSVGSVGLNLTIACIIIFLVRFLVILVFFLN